MAALYAAEVLADVPNLYFRCAEASGNIADSSGNAAVGTANGSITYQAASPLGFADRAVTFDGSTGYFTVPDGVLTDLGDVFTLECWSKTTTYTAIQSLLTKDTGAYKLSLDNTSGLLRLTINKIGTGAICSGTTAYPQDGAWHHLVATKNGAAVKLYQDGVDVTGVVTNSTLTNTATALNIGRSTSNTQYFRGSLDEVAVYPTVLSAARVAAHYAAAVASGFYALTASALTITAAPSTGNGQYPASTLYPSSTLYPGGWALTTASTNTLTLTVAS